MSSLKDEVAYSEKINYNAFPELHSEKELKGYEQKKGEFMFAKVEGGKEVQRYVANCDAVSNTSSLDQYEGKSVEKKLSLGKLQSLK
eukprot:CAMPEP_0170567560 /NCGR_PEP_ID=MMETSP0211-20121228/80559_1 /TAXON_ID=311385 /ORGANISM="Pseudokeronopsis sp., Strain OXSARD2" /LENGTH=86 /DNA_ID=CAMNT_0010889051 /DNA_START=1329 /DNA_END=1589 /DNA_ORIENTATION=-